MKFSAPQGYISEATASVMKPGTLSRYLSIDALRGTAALGVVAYHVVGAHPQKGIGGALSFLAMPFVNAFSFGYVSVFLFFVISGFCIHLQWTRQRAEGKDPEIPFGAFWKRRFRRLYPPYIIALVLYLSIAAWTSDVRITPFYIWDAVSHVFMLHNLDTKTVYSINGVFWTLAIEEQLYLAYFLLLYLRKRGGWGLALFATLVARVAWFFLAKGLEDFAGVKTPLTEAAMAHWFTWSLGAISVEAAFGLVKLPLFLRRFSIGILFLVGAGYLAFLLDNHSEGAVHDLLWVGLHPAWGLGFFCIVNAAINAEKSWRADARIPRLVSLMASIGVFSYSIYLIHELVLMETWRFYFLGLSDTITALLITAPLSVASAWVFFLLCERPFLSKNKKSEKSVAGASQVELASI